MTVMQRLIPPTEAAAFLGVRPGTLAIWRCTKRYALAYVRAGRKIYYLEADLAAFIATRRVTPQGKGTR